MKVPSLQMILHVLATQFFWYPKVAHGFSGAATRMPLHIVYTRGCRSSSTSRKRLAESLPNGYHHRLPPKSLFRFFNSILDDCNQCFQPLTDGVPAVGLE